MHVLEIVSERFMALYVTSMRLRYTSPNEPPAGMRRLCNPNFRIPYKRPIRLVVVVVVVVVSILFHQLTNFLILTSLYFHCSFDGSSRCFCFGLLPAALPWVLCSARGWWAGSTTCAPTAGAVCERPTGPFWPRRSELRQRFQIS